MASLHRTLPSYFNGELVLCWIRTKVLFRKDPDHLQECLVVDYTLCALIYANLWSTFLVGRCLALE